MKPRQFPRAWLALATLAVVPIALAAGDVGGDLSGNGYSPSQPQARPKPKPEKIIVEKPVPDESARRRAAAAEARAKALEAENGHLKSKAKRQVKRRPAPAPVAVTPAATPVATPTPVVPPAPLPATDPAAACLKNGAWQAGCGFAAFAGGPVFRVVGGSDSGDVLRFTMGTNQGADGMADNYEAPAHPVRFDRRFALAETEVTVAQYLACVQDHQSCAEPEWREAGSDYHYQTGQNSSYRDKKAHLPDRPITGVSWKNAQQYVAWLNRWAGQNVYALPTEAQWEYAARGGQNRRWYFGDAQSALQDHAWYTYNSGGALHPVGSTPLNHHPWGLQDMAGNAWEWVEDCWHKDYNQAPEKGDQAWEGANGGDCGQRVLRGGSWYSFVRDTRAANRFRGTAGIRFDNVSFRPSRMLP